MTKWILIILALVVAWLYGWRINLDAIKHDPSRLIARTGKDVISNFNPSKFFDEASGNDRRLAQSQQNERNMASYASQAPGGGTRTRTEDGKGWEIKK